MLYGFQNVGGKCYMGNSGNIWDRCSGSFGEKVSLLLTYWKQPVPLIKAIGISFIFHALIIIIHILIGMFLEMTIPWEIFLFVVPLVITVGMLPVSLSGRCAKLKGRVDGLDDLIRDENEHEEALIGLFTILV